MITAPVTPIRFRLAMPRKMKPMCATLELPMSRFRSFCRIATQPTYKMLPRQSHARQTVKAKLLQHPCVQHRGRRRRGTVAQWRPGMERPERNQNAKTKQQQRKDEILRAHGERAGLGMFNQLRDVESIRAGLQVERDKADERNQRANAQIKCDLKRGVILPFAAA